VEELRALFWQEAEKYNVLPLLGGMTSFFGIVPPVPKQSKFTYYGDVQNVSAGAIPRIYNRSYTITAELVIPEGGAEGVIVAEADNMGGYSLFVQDGRLKHTYSMMGVLVYTQEADQPLPSGEVQVRLSFDADEEAKPATGGAVTLLVNDEQVAEGRMEHTVPQRFSGYAGMDIGRDNGLPVDLSYADKSPFAFTGTIKKVVFDINPNLDAEGERAVHEHAHAAAAAHAISA
jgi:arylsulfatase